LVALAGNDVIRRAAGGSLRFVGADDVFVEGFDQLLERGAMRVFGGVAALEGAFEFAQIFDERRGFSATPVCGWFFVKKIGLGHDGMVIGFSPFDQLCRDSATPRF
jgi:hypothetical protein